MVCVLAAAIDDLWIVPSVPVVPLVLAAINITTYIFIYQHKEHGRCQQSTNLNVNFNMERV